jgi:APA family basic amino acid/polyamine antiporter
MNDHADKPQTIGIWMTSALVIGTIIGSAIFMLPVTLAPLGVNALIGWLVSGVGVLCIAFALAQLSHLGGEGIQANIEREFGPTAGFLVAWAFWVSNWAAQASVAIGAASALSFIGPQFGSQGMILIVAISCVVLLTGINASGVRAAGGFSMVTVAIKILPLMAVIWLFAARGASGAAYEPLAPLPVTIANIATATALTFFALTGFESATAPVGKVRNPARTLPRARRPWAAGRTSPRQTPRQETPPEPAWTYQISTTMGSIIGLRFVFSNIYLLTYNTKCTVSPVQNTQVY